MFQISILTIVKEVKSIHPEFVTIIKVGTFCNVFGKDASILADLFGYQFKKMEDTITCGFPVVSLKKVQAELENDKINYLIMDRRSGYTVEEKVDFKNLNTYRKHYERSKIFVNNQKKINNIYEYLTQNAKSANLMKILNEMERLINEGGKI